MAENPTQKPLVPTFTGNPVYDSMIGAALVSASTALATTSVTWMNAHGFTGVTIDQVAGALIGIGGAVFTVAWRYVQSKKTNVAMAEHVIDAAANGNIPDSIKKVAVAAPEIPDSKIATAVVNASAISTVQLEKGAP